MKDFNELIQRSYEAIKKRCLITKNTSPDDFIIKMNEELSEVEYEGGHYQHGLYKDKNKYKIKYIEELTDLATVAIMQIHHLGYDFVKEFEKVIIKNEKRH